MVPAQCQPEDLVREIHFEKEPKGIEVFHNKEATSESGQVHFVSRGNHAGHFPEAQIKDMDAFPLIGVGNLDQVLSTGGEQEPPVQSQLVAAGTAFAVQRVHLPIPEVHGARRIARGVSQTQSPVDDPFSLRKDQAVPLRRVKGLYFRNFLVSLEVEDSKKGVGVRAEKEFVVHGDLKPVCLSRGKVYSFCYFAGSGVDHENVFEVPRNDHEPVVGGFGHAEYGFQFLVDLDLGPGRVIVDVYAGPRNMARVQLGPRFQKDPHVVVGLDLYIAV